MRPGSSSRRHDSVGLFESLFLLPLAGRVFSSAPSDLLYVALGPLLLMLHFAAFQIVGDASVLDLVSDLELVFVGVARTSHTLSPFESSSCGLSSDCFVEQHFTPMIFSLTVEGDPARMRLSRLSFWRGAICGAPQSNCPIYCGSNGEHCQGLDLTHANRSPIVQTWSVIPAAIAGVILSEPWSLQKL